MSEHKQMRTIDDCIQLDLLALENGLSISSIHREHLSYIQRTIQRIDDKSTIIVHCSREPFHL